MDKQLREILQEYTDTLKDRLKTEPMTNDWVDRVIFFNTENLINELESYINSNYVSKDKVRGLKMEEVFEQSEFEDGYNQAVSEINTAIDTLISVPTPESLTYDL